MKNLFFVLSIALLACGSCKKKEADQNLSVDYKLHYAKGFTVKDADGYRIVEVRNPWDTTRLLNTYILVDRQKELPSHLPQGIVVRTPIQNAIAYSTIHCSSLEELGELDILKGVCESQYIGVEAVKAGVANGKIIDVGLAGNPDVEKILELAPEAIFTSPINGQSYGRIAKTRIPIIEAPDYMESEPLGRAEWLRFYSLFTDKEVLADSLFSVTVGRYNNIKAKVAEATTKPSVLTDTKYQSSWNIPGGKSFLANMLADAKAGYPWSDDASTSFLPLSFEAVLDKAGETDIWIIKYYSPEDMTYQSLQREYAPYAHFKPFKEKKIYGCNTFYSKYYDDLPIHPDYILEDFAAIFHPEMFPGYEPRYYKMLK